MTIEEVELVSCGANIAGIGLAINRTVQKDLEFPTTKSPPQGNTQSTQDVNGNINFGPLTNTGLLNFLQLK